MISEQAQEFHTRCLRFGDGAADALTRMSLRDYAGELYASFGAATDFISRDAVIGGIAGLWVEPPQVRQDAVLLFMHGGGYMSGSSKTHARFAAHIARRLGTRAFLPDYRLVPEATFPAQIEDCLSAYAGLLDAGLAPEKIAFSGESAGGALAISTQLLALRRGVPVPAAAYVMSPWLDIDHTGNSYTDNADLDLLSAVEMSAANFSGFAGGYVDRSDPLLNPLRADLSGLSPVYAQAGTVEIVRDDAVRLVERVRGAGGAAELELLPYMQHLVQMNAGVVPEADAALDNGAAFLRRHLR